MRYAPGYDRDFASQFFRRTFNSLAPEGKMPHAKILPLEVEYMARYLSDTTISMAEGRMGSPWYFGNYKDLAEMTSGSRDRGLLDMAERAANQILVLHGVVARAGIFYYKESFWSNKLDRPRLARILYYNASKMPCLDEQQSFVLRRMSLNVDNWIELLSRIHGNDYLEMLGTRLSPIITLPGEE